MAVIATLIFVHYKVILFVDNCPAHPHSVATKLEAIKLVFFPPNLTSILQPCDLGIIRSMKHYYREKIVKTMVNCVEQEIEFPNINVLDAINTMAEIWTVNVKPSTISNCFRKGGFVDLGASSAECNDENSMQNLGEENISEVCNCWEAFRAGTGSTAEIIEFADYVDIDAHARAH
jgi:hypothetical protein